MYHYSPYPIVSNAVIEPRGGQFIKINNCTCPGDILTYNCEITGSGFTIWRGSAFNCPGAGSRILLRHSLFGGSGAMGSCNNGAIAGRSLGVNMDNTVYASQLMINLNAPGSDFIGKTVECVYLNTGIESIIGSTTIQLTGC